MVEVNFYNILGVDFDASIDEIKKAYRELALAHHPDKAGNTPEANGRFVEIGAAYEILSDADKRREYDRRNGFDVRTTHRQPMAQRNRSKPNCPHNHSDTPGCETCWLFSEQVVFIFKSLHKQCKASNGAVPRSPALPDDFFPSLKVRLMMTAREHRARIDILMDSIIRIDRSIGPQLFRDAMQVRHGLSVVQQKIERLGQHINEFLTRSNSSHALMDLAATFAAWDLLVDIELELRLANVWSIEMRSILGAMSRSSLNVAERRRNARQLTDLINELLRQSQV
ncbi:hypothetical protein F5Y15DRAFT_421356 [Xylariaceae sp. FL0016]|nr:hypothetical protein F5Y15DRAFT_421356 [Xylariaceae sp. FL0016]